MKDEFVFFNIYFVIYIKRKRLSCNSNRCNYEWCRCREKKGICCTRSKVNDFDEAIRLYTKCSDKHSNYFIVVITNCISLFNHRSKVFSMIDGIMFVVRDRENYNLFLFLFIKITISQTIFPFVYKIMNIHWPSVALFLLTK